MRNNAPWLITALLVAATPFAATANSITIDGFVYSEGADPVFVDSLYDVDAVEFTPETYSEGEITYVTEDATYAETIRAPYVTEETSVVPDYVDASYSTGMTEQATAMETIDGIVYETVTDGGFGQSEEAVVISTY